MKNVINEHLSAVEEMHLLMLEKAIEERRKEEFQNMLDAACHYGYFCVSLNPEIEPLQAYNNLPEYRTIKDYTFRKTADFAFSKQIGNRTILFVYYLNVQKECIKQCGPFLWIKK